MSTESIAHEWSIRRLVLLNSNVNSKLFVDPSIDASKPLSLSLNAGIGRSEDRTGLITQLTIESSEEPGDPYAFQVTWAVEFAVPVELNDSDAATLGAENGLHILWPYARQHISQLTGSLGFTPLFLPLIAPRNIVSEAEQDEESLALDADASEGSTADGTEASS